MIGWQEMILIFAVLLLVFGPTKLPKIAKELGKAWHEFNKASSGVFETESSAKTSKKEDKTKLLLEAAKKLGVDTEGKTGSQLVEEISTKIINTKETLPKKEGLP